MSLPPWALRALDEFKPALDNEEIESGDARPRRWEVVRERFEYRWRDLAPDSWHIPADAPFYARLLGGLSVPVDEHLRRCILEVAVECALENEARPRPAPTKKTGKKAPPVITQVVNKLGRLNDEISHAAGELADLFRARETLMRAHHLGDQHGDDDTQWPDVFELAGALKRTLEQQRFGSASFRHRDGLEALYGALKSNYRESPTLADVLEVVSSRTPRPPIARRLPDLVELGATKTKSTEWSVLQRQLVEGLATWAGLPDGFLVRCLDLGQIATLAEVTFDASAGAFNDDQTKKLLLRMNRQPYQSGRFKPKKRAESS